MKCGFDTVWDVNNVRVPHEDVPIFLDIIIPDEVIANAEDTVLSETIGCVTVL